MLTPRSYQTELVNLIRKEMVEKGFRRVAAWAPTGSGKSVVCAILAKGSADKGTKTLIISHRIEIIKQNFKKLDDLGIRPAQIHVATKFIPTEAKLCVGMAQTIASRCSRENREAWRKWVASFDLIIADECHRIEPEAVLQYAREDACIIGLSATLARRGNNTRQLGETYDSIVRGIGTRELIEMGYLVPGKYYSFQAPDLSDAAWSYATGDYNGKSLAKKFMNRQRYVGVLSNFQRLIPDKKTLVFCTSAEHCIELCREFRDAGISAKYILSGQFPDTDIEMSGRRQWVLNQFKSGEIQVLFSCQALTTGLDITSIEAIVVDTATDSYANFIQMIGRGSRPHPGKKEFVCLDFGNNLTRHGRLESEPVISLWHTSSLASPLAPLVKECPGCSRLIPVQAKTCPRCDYKFLSEREAYEIDLREYLESDEALPEDLWIGRRITEGWSIQRILITLMVKVDHRLQKQVFDRACTILRTKSGKHVAPAYYYYIRKIMKGNYRKK